MKKFFILSVLLCLLTTSKMAFASTSVDLSKGVLDDTDIIKSNSLPKEWYDNDLETSFPNSTTVRIVEFNEPIDIVGYYYMGAQSASSVVSFKFIGDTVKNVNGTMGLGYMSIDVENVTTIHVYRISGTGYLKEIEFFTSPKALQPPKDITRLQAKVEYDRVDLSWNLPNSENLKHVNIYRDKIVKTTMLEDVIFDRAAAAATTKIFETNGTYFNDLTVQEKTTYEYKLTTQSMEGLESAGLTKTVTTPSKPLPTIGGGVYEEENGDYIYSWTAPTTGKVRVLVGGKIFATVNAADKKIKIPHSDMKFNLFGAPDVQLIAIDEDGTEGEPKKPPSKDGGDPGEVKVPFSPTDLLKTSTGLLWLVGSLVLLALAFLLVPRLRKMIVQAFSKNKKETNDRRIKVDNERHEKREKKTAREPRQPRYKTNRERFGGVKRSSVKEPRQSRVKEPRERRERVKRDERKGR